MKKDKYSPARKWDFTFNCMICGNKCFASESHLLDTYTGRGGLRVCSECNDPIDYGIVPYKIPAEKSTSWSADAMNSANPDDIETDYGPWDYINFDPMGTAPILASGTQNQWENLNIKKWEEWTTLWGS